jgi:hypothetical protein
MTTTDSTQSSSTDAKPLHPLPPAGSDSGHEQQAKKAETPIGGGLGAATLAEVRKLVAAVEKPFVSDGNTLTFTPLDTAKDGSATPAKPVEKSVSGEKNPAVGKKAATVVEKAPVVVDNTSAVNDKTSVTGEKTVAAPPTEKVQPVNGDKTTVTAGQPTSPPVAPPASKDTVTSTDAPKDSTAPLPDPDANKSAFTVAAEWVAGEIGLPKSIVDTAENYIGEAWSAVGNYASDLLTNSTLQQSMVSTDKDGQIQVDQQKAQQVIDMQAMKNVFQGTGGSQHIDQVNKMFDQSPAKAAAPGTETAAYKDLDAQRKQMIAEGHKPGDSWSDKNGVYSLDAQGNLLEVTGSNTTRDIKWIGQNGQSYEKDPSGNETWTKDGRTIQQLGKDKFEFKDEFGNTTDLQGDAGITVRRVAAGTITSYDQNRTEITKEAAAKLTDGISTNPNAALYAHHDAQGNQLVKDSLVHGETIYAKDGQTYRIHDGQVYTVDKYGQEDKTEKLPDFLKRNADGSIQFDDINVNSKDFLHADDHNTKMADKTAVITAGSADHPLTVTAGNGDVTVAVKGEFDAKSHTDAKTGVTTEHQTDSKGNNEFNYNSKTGTVAGDGITFTHNGSHIQGAKFAVSSSGQIESASSWNRANYASGINDASDSYISSHNNYNDISYADSSDSSNTSNNGNSDDSADNANGGNQDSSGDGNSNNQTDDADSADAPGSYQQYDKEKDHEEKVEERKLSKWDQVKAKHEADASSLKTDHTGVNEWREDLRADRWFALPESWKVANIKEVVNVSGLQASIGRADHGMVDTGDLAYIVAAKAQLGAAASKFDFDADGVLARLDGIGHKIEREVSVKAALEDVGSDATPDHMWRVYKNGGGVSAAREVQQLETA